MNPTHILRGDAYVDERLLRYLESIDKVYAPRTETARVFEDLIYMIIKRNEPNIIEQLEITHMFAQKRLSEDDDAPSDYVTIYDIVTGLSSMLNKLPREYKDPPTRHKNKRVRFDENSIIGNSMSKLVITDV